jgi:hypothetical protein
VIGNETNDDARGNCDKCVLLDGGLDEALPGTAKLNEFDDGNGFGIGFELACFSE